MVGLRLMVITTAASTTSFRLAAVAAMATSDRETRLSGILARFLLPDHPGALPAEASEDHQEGLLADRRTRPDPLRRCRQMRARVIGTAADAE